MTLKKLLMVAADGVYADNTEMAEHGIILASTSAIRAKLLRDAGVTIETVPPRVDESALKASLLAEEVTPVDLAASLAEMKSTKVSARMPGTLVLGADQVLDFEGEVFDKPGDLSTARAHLKRLSGRRHRLISAAVISEGGKPVFRATQSVTLHMRPLGAEFLDMYLQQAGPEILSCVGGYQLEGLGAQLFHRIDGDYFVVLGLPLLDILGYLRERGILRA